MVSRRDFQVLAARALGLLFAVLALDEVSYLPERVLSFLRYRNQEPASISIEYWRHYYLIELAFLVVRIVGFSLLARWLYRGGPEVEELLLHSASDVNAAQN